MICRLIRKEVEEGRVTGGGCETANAVYVRERVSIQVDTHGNATISKDRKVTY